VIGIIRNDCSGSIGTGARNQSVRAAGREGIENLVDGPVKWDDFALEATPGWLGTDGSEIPGLPGRARFVDLLARSGLRVITIVEGKMRLS
jgi:hypothetical protein